MDLIIGGRKASYINILLTISHHREKCLQIAIHTPRLMGYKVE